ncbi:MAG: adenosine kinase [Alphaproteobacteria bacterium]|jgi:sugar/nucleoside kinase (ribokinase family)|nr:adenosine kinase [Alphaproteobacteria bacterium]MDP7172616.1 adenosine kinase [Alphaproteobacteria bacterium]MDP7234275.1 adenosine kinase [Alphaproteobacteria bacterium]MDP7486901.1 adenosine kinase [Alphaproteobacteria bacterium]HJN21295.1 adenosine kinase [Alphaproteobacteria bacterium]|tara:strand:- start:2494 stop:3471 length:978 start_codon:yes stop_codon:yes gene_type:complete
MVQTEIDVLGIGNAIVDVLSHAEDSFLDSHGLTKGAMALIDPDQVKMLYDAMGSGVEISGGSAANTIAGLASFGGRGAFIGKVRDDQLGEVFAHDIRALGVRFDTRPTSDGASTARCLILVTPDAQRTLNTFLGACVELRPEDIDADLVEASAVTYLEGYLWDPPRAKNAFRKAVEIAHNAGRKVALTLSDSFCVDRYRDEFCALVAGGADIVFANETELLSLYGVDTFDEGLRAIRENCEVAVLTRSEKGSVIVDHEEVHVIDATPVEHVVDTTGAGDLFAAGFLYGYTRGDGLAECGRLGSLAAAEIISHFGARPDVALSTLV